MTDNNPADDTLLDEIFDTDRDRAGDDAPAEPEKTVVAEPEPTPEPEPRPEEEPPKAAEPEARQEEDDSSQNRHVPLSELLKEREKFRNREDEIRREAQERERQYQEALRVAIERQQAAQQQPKPEPIDPYVDPQGALQQVTQDLRGQFEEQLINTNLHMSERFARMKYGDEAVNQAFQAAQAANALGHFSSNPDGWNAMVNWHQREQALAKVGTDVDAYEKQIREEERKKVLEELKQGGQQPTGAPQQQPQQRIPGTLTGVTAAGTQPVAVSDEALLNDIFANDRDRRA